MIQANRGKAQTKRSKNVLIQCEKQSFAHFSSKLSDKASQTDDKPKKTAYTARRFIPSLNSLVSKTTLQNGPIAQLVRAPDS